MLLETSILVLVEFQFDGCDRVVKVREARGAHGW
jgi:hypothetical protein